MTSKERVRKTFNHEEPDRVPIFELTVANPILSRVLGRKIEGMVTGESKISSLRANRQGRAARKELIERNTRGMVEAYKKIGFDMVWIRPFEYLTPVEMAMNDFISANMIFDVTIEEIDDVTYQIIDETNDFWSLEKYSPQSNTCPTLMDAIYDRGVDELKRYVSVIEKRDVAPNQEINDGLEGTRIAVELGKTEDLFVLGCADIAFPTFYPWISPFMELMVIEPECIHRYMEVTTAGTLELLKHQLEIGVDGVLGSNDWCYRSGSLMSPHHFKTFLAPYLKTLVDECHRHGVPYIKHLDGNIMPIVDSLVNDVGVDGIHSIEPTSSMDIGWMKERYGNHITLLGNIDCGDILISADQDTVIREVKQIISAASPGGGHIFSSSNCIHSGVNQKNFEVMLQAVQEFGQYPIS